MIHLIRRLFGNADPDLKPDAEAAAQQKKRLNDVIDAAAVERERADRVVREARVSQRKLQNQSEEMVRAIRRARGQVATGDRR